MLLSKKYEEMILPFYSADIRLGRELLSMVCAIQSAYNKIKSAEDVLAVEALLHMAGSVIMWWPDQAQNDAIKILDEWKNDYFMTDGVTNDEV